jgi:hypothetical protein
MFQVEAAHVGPPQQVEVRRSRPGPPEPEAVRLVPAGRCATDLDEDDGAAHDRPRLARAAPSLRERSPRNRRPGRRGILRTSHIERLPCPDTLGPHASCPAPTHTCVAHPRPSLLNPGRSSLEPSLASATLLARTASRRVFATGRAARTLHQPRLYGPGRRQASIAPGPALAMHGVDGVSAPVRRQRKKCLTHQPRRWTGSVQSATLQMCVTGFLSSLSRAGHDRMVRGSMPGYGDRRHRVVSGWSQSTPRQTLLAANGSCTLVRTAMDCVSGPVRMTHLKARELAVQATYVATVPTAALHTASRGAVGFPFRSGSSKEVSVCRR